MKLPSGPLPSRQRGGVWVPTSRTPAPESSPTIADLADSSVGFLADLTQVTQDLAKSGLPGAGLCGLLQSGLAGSQCKVDGQKLGGSGKLASGLAALGELPGLDLLGNTLQLLAAAREGKSWDVAENLVSVCTNPVVLTGITVACPAAGGFCSLVSNVNLYRFAAKYAAPLCKVITNPPEDPSRPTYPEFIDEPGWPPCRKAGHELL